MNDKIMHTLCLNCGKPAVSVPFGLEGLPYENYSYCPDCIHKAMKLLKHKKIGEDRIACVREGAFVQDDKALPPEWFCADGEEV